MQNKRRGLAMISSVLVIVVLFSYYYFVQSGVVYGYDEEIDSKVVSDKAVEEEKLLYEGIIYDCEDYQITAKQDDKVICLYPESYNIIGISSDIYGRSDIRKMYEDFLFQEEGKEAGIFLTTDTSLQQYCYDKLKDHKGSIIVLDNNTGAIKAMVSKSDESMDYDINEIDTNFGKYSQIDGFFMNQALAADTPGSTFKMITAISLYENNLADYTFDDSGEYGGVVNAGGAAYGMLDINNGLINSANTFFASATDKLGPRNLEKTAHEFLIGEDIQLDMGFMESNFDMEYYQDKRLNEDTGYGQGKTLVSPLQMAMIMSTIVNEGMMYKPYIVRKITINGNMCNETTEEILSDSFDEEALVLTKENLHNVALDYGFDEESFGMIYAKTGTAENDNGTPPHIYLVCANETYTVSISIDDTYESSRSLIPVAQDIFEYISDMRSEYR